jgi:hypothetical protein
VQIAAFESGVALTEGANVRFSLSAAQKRLVCFRPRPAGPLCAEIGRSIDWASVSKADMAGARQIFSGAHKRSAIRCNQRSVPAYPSAFFVGGLRWRMPLRLSSGSGTPEASIAEEILQLLVSDLYRCGRRNVKAPGPISDTDT